MKKSTAIMPIVALLLGMATPSVQAAPSPAAPSPEMCRTLPKSAPWKNHPTHIWNVVWRNKVALCTLQAKLDQLQSAKVPSLPVNQPAVNQPAVNQPAVPAPQKP